jgi:branched-chain amino acid transport system ATP-binding protein
MAAILQLHGVVAGYGAGDILKGVDLRIDAGTVTCLIGPNGAGKSTVLKTVSGLLRPGRGRVVYRDQEISQLRPRARLLMGIVHVPQDRSLFPAMTVRDNLLMGGYVIKDPKVVRARLEQAVAAFPICASRASAQAGSLSGGEQKQVELARTLILDPKLVLLDEPSIGLDPKSRHTVFESIRTLSATGVTILLVEQNARAALSVASHGYIMEQGKVVLDGSASELRDNEDVKEFYLGGAGDQRKSFKNLKSFKRRKRWL